MDVQPAPNVGAIASSGSTASAPSASYVNSSSVQVSQVAQPVVSASQNDGGQQQQQSQQNTTLTPAISKLFAGVISAPAQLAVSYRVEGNDVVTVFTDPNTHKEVAQFPPELLIGLAQFFDQQSGVTLDRTA